MPKVAVRVDLGSVLARLAAPSGDDVDARVLDAAGALLLAGGVEAVEVEDVAARAGVGRSTIYRRFDGRNELLAAAVAHEARRFFATLADEVADVDDPAERVVVAFATGLRLARVTGLSERIRTDPLLLRLLTVDAGPLVVMAGALLGAEATRVRRRLDPAVAAGVGELLVRLAVSFVVTPTTGLALDDGSVEATLRRYLAPLLAVR